jgi:hypothetical protein
MWQPTQPLSEACFVKDLTMFENPGFFGVDHRSHQPPGFISRMSLSLKSPYGLIGEDSGSSVIIQLIHKSSGLVPYACRI